MPGIHDKRYLPGVKVDKWSIADSRMYGSNIKRIEIKGRSTSLTNLLPPAASDDMPATPTQQLVTDLGLQRHPEGGKSGASYGFCTRPVGDTRAAGYFRQTDIQEETVPTPFAGAMMSL
jgi:hypothetical protein